MKLLVFADLHLDTTFRWLGTNSQGSRKLRNSLRDTLKRILQLAVDERVDALLCAGDLYEHEHFSPDTVRFLEKSFAELNPISVLIAPGNHDWFGPGSIYATAAWSPNVKIFQEKQFSAVELSNGLTIWGYAHRTPSESLTPIAAFSVDRGGINLALFHGAENRISLQLTYDKGKYGAFSAADLERAGFNHAFVGHYHNAIDERLFTYPGNPHPLEFGEEGERGPVLVEIDQSGKISKTRIPVTQQIFFDVNLDVSEAKTSQDIREQVVAALEGRSGFARVTLVGDLAPEIDLRLEDLHPTETSLDACIFRLDRVRVAYDVSKISEEPTVRGLFCKKVLGSNLDDQLKQRVLVTGLRALEGRQDLDTIDSNAI